MIATPGVAAADDATLSGAWTQFVGAGVAGDGDRAPRYGGRVDLYGSLALDSRFTLTAHPEFVYAKNVNAIGDGSSLPLNTALLLPQDGGEDFDLSVSGTLKLGAAGSTLTFGKVNLLDLAARVPIVGGGGLEGFQNIELAAPPSGLVPPSLLGAMLSVPTRAGIFGLWVYDPASQTNKTGFEHPFRTGVSVLASATFPISIGGLAGFQNFKVAANSVTGFDLEDLPQVLLPSGTVIPGTRKGGWNIGYSFQQFLWQNPNAKGTGWGIFGQVGLSDGNPTPLGYNINIGIGGNPWTGRPDDRFGLAYFRLNFSSVLVHGVAPFFPLGDEHGVEAFYTVPLGKRLRLTGDVQVVRPADKDKSTAAVLGGRLKASF